jgi:hypothetical protein
VLEKRSTALLPMSWSAIARCHLEEDLLHETELLWEPKNKEQSQVREV